MTNEEYIKVLENRIEIMEKFFAQIVLDEKQNIIFNGCDINAMALQKCRNITFENNEIESGGFIAFTNHVSNSIIHNFQSDKSKSTIKKCDIH